MVASASSEDVAVDRRSVLGELWEAERRRPEAVLLRGTDGERKVAEFAATVRRCAGWLRSLGVNRGDRVALLADNSELIPALWYGIYLAGAVEVPINAQLKGLMLQHVLDDSEPSFVLVDPPHLGTIETVETRAAIVVIDDEAVSGWERAGMADRHDPDPTDLATIMYTSGTTGPSKGVMLPHGYYANMGHTWTAAIGLREDDVSHFSLPMFHVDSHVTFACVVVSGGIFGFMERFSASRFWNECDRLGSTWFVGVGAMLAAICRHPRPPGLDIRVTRGFGAPIPDEAFELFEDTYGIELFQLYGQTEADGITFETPERRRRGSAGWPGMGFDVRIVDDLGRKLPPESVGEIVYRPRHANMMMIGYWNRPDATVAATRDLWFHSGDLGRFDEDGFLWFSGRKRDSLRHRGENISAFELEQTIRQAPGIADCAAIGVLDGIGGEDEIKVFVTLEPGSPFDATAFFTYCENNLARFAIPRFVETIDESAVVRSSGTGVVQKHLLPTERGPHTIDRTEILS